MQLNFSSLFGELMKSFYFPLFNLRAAASLLTSLMLISAIGCKNSGGNGEAPAQSPPPAPPVANVTSQPQISTNGQNEYSIQTQNCSTGRQTFRNANEFCQALLDEKLNSNCAIEARRELHKKHCARQNTDVAIPDVQMEGLTIRTLRVGQHSAIAMNQQALQINTKNIYCVRDIERTNSAVNRRGIVSPGGIVIEQRSNVFFKLREGILQIKCIE
jgi:hypothetical protein